MIYSKKVDMRGRPLLQLWSYLFFQFQKVFFKQELYRRAAIHESGHIVFSYFYGFTVDEAMLLLDVPGQGNTRTVYGKDIRAANIVFNHGIRDFANLNPSEQARTYAVGHHLMFILYAGGCAEAYLKRKPLDKKYDLQLERGQSGEGDLDGIEAIEGFYQKIGQPVNRTNVLVNLFGLFEQYPIFKLSIETISKLFLDSTSKKLTKSDIEVALKSVDFFNVREQIMDANSK